MLSVVKLSITYILCIAMLNVIIPSAALLSGIMLNVIMLSVEGP
jgi:hypothetical protein